MKLYLPLILIFITIGCGKSENDSYYLEKIYMKENWDHDGILFLTESANVERMNDDSLDFYVTKDERLQALDSIGYPVDEEGSIIGDINDSTLSPVDTVYERKIIFKNYGQIFHNDKIFICTIYKSNNESNGRNHQFYLRTYDKQHNLIDTLLFATWNDDNSLYFSGELTNDLKVKRLNKDEELIAEYQISDNGTFQKDKK